MPSPFYSALPPPIPIDRMTPLGSPTPNRPFVQADQPRSAVSSPGYSLSSGDGTDYTYDAPFYVPSRSPALPTSAQFHGEYASAPPFLSPSYSSTPPGSGTYTNTPASTTIRFPFPLMNSNAQDASFKVETDRKDHTTRIMRADGYEVARFDWETSLRGLSVHIMGSKEMKGREWARLHDSDGTRTIRHRGESYLCKPQYGGYTVFQEGAAPVAAWYDERGEYVLNAYSEALRIPGMLDVCVAAMILLQSGHSLGDRGPAPPSPSPASQTQASTDGKGQSSKPEGTQSIGAVARDSFLESLGDNVGQAIGAAIVAAV